MEFNSANIHNLGNIFNPGRVALLGASTNPNSVSGKTLSNLVTGGFRGVVYPINATAEAVLGIPCFSDLRTLPRKPDLAIICTPAGEVPDAVAMCGECGIDGIIIMSAGFKETGAEGRKLEEAIKAEASRYPEMRIIGPNCLGIIVPSVNLNASFAAAMPKAGDVAFISQSGALCTSVLDWALEAKIGFSAFISIGNTSDVDFGDLIDYLGEDEKTKSIILYIESINNARKFMTAARAFARSKPILVYKAGRFPESALVAASHTGALASEDAVYDAAFQRAGLARVYDIGDIFDCAELIGRGRMPGGPELAIVTNAGGPGVMATDALLANGGKLAILSDETKAELDEILPPFWSKRNPVDVLGDCPPKRLEKAVQIVAKDKGVKAVLVILTPQAMTNPNSAARLIGKLAGEIRKPLLAAWLGGETMREGIRILLDSGVAAYQTPEQAIRSFMTLVAYSRNLKMLYETPRELAVEVSVDKQNIRKEFLELAGRNGQVVDEGTSKWLLEQYGIATTVPILASTVESAIEHSQRLGFPLVLKIASPDISHKSDVNGVALNIISTDMVAGAFSRIISDAQRLRPDARIDGVTVQRQVDGKEGVELILGIKRDPVFGSVILTGLGGIGVELFGDRSIGLPPLSERLARRLLESLKTWPLLNGFRGKPAIDIDQLIATIIRLSYIAADFPEIAELDINPLLATPAESVALDARILLTQTRTEDGVTGTYDHLALVPYPEHYQTKEVLKDGTELIFRPIKPEDEAIWLDLLRNCSKESLYHRFRSLFHWDSHDVATRFCFIDYDREIAIVAEVEENGKKALAGIGRLIADPDHEAVEYAVLIADKWQKRELGVRLTSRCIEISRHWNLKKIVATTTTSNRPMVSVFQKLGFRVSFPEGDEMVEVELDLR